MSALTLQDALVIEGEEEGDVAAALQCAINSGTAWSMQGSYGRAMIDAIEDGVCLLGRASARDYWGHYIPSRDEVQAGTKGSYDYVVERWGKVHADAMAAL